MRISKQELLTLSGVGHETLNVWIEEEWQRFFRRDKLL
jgi:endonuclease III